MASTISLDGISSPAGEDRALAHLTVHYNGNIYSWQIYIPQDSGDLATFLENSKPLIESQIDSKEAQWAALEPKTRTITDMDNEIIVNIEKSEIVRPDIPDYYALRRNEYPPLSEQLGALWKGIDSPDYIAIQQKILDVKNKYPKPTT